MLKKDRHNIILDEVNDNKRVISSNLSQQLQVSEDTIRRDLLELAATGSLLKVHGGALAAAYTNLPTERQYKIEEIARKTIPFIEDNMLLIASGGPILNLIANLLPENISITILTFDLLTALQMNRYKNIRVIIMGGQLSNKSEHLVVTYQVQTLQEIKADLCLIEAEGVSVGQGLTGSEWEMVQVKKAMIQSANQTIAVCCSDHLNIAHPMQICGLNQLTALITDQQPHDLCMENYHHMKMRVY